MKTCGKCKQNKPLSSFNKKLKGLQPFCRNCNSDYLKQHYSANKQYYKEKAVKQSRKIKTQVYEFLMQHPCIDCGETDPVVLHFDHIDSDNKKFTISNAAKNGSAWSTILSEIEKCVVRCANCHARRTAEQFGWYSWMQN